MASNVEKQDKKDLEGEESKILRFGREVFRKQACQLSQIFCESC